MTTPSCRGLPQEQMAEKRRGAPKRLWLWGLLLVALTACSAHKKLSKSREGNVIPPNRYTDSEGPRHAPQNLTEARQHVTFYQQRIKRQIQELRQKGITPQVEAQEAGKTTSDMGRPPPTPRAAVPERKPRARQTPRRKYKKKYKKLCQTICRSAQSICRSAQAICRIARQFPQDPSMGEACQKARRQCLAARSSCQSCQQRSP